MINSEKFLLRFWGVRGSYPVPGPHTLHFGGNTTCFELLLGDYPLIIDAGTGIINLGSHLIAHSMAANGKPIVATILITHTHHDHTQGFPYFAPNFFGSSILTILGPRTFQRGLEEALSHTVMPPNFPIYLQDMPSLRSMHDLKRTEHVLLNPATGEHHIYDPMRQPPPPHAEKLARLRPLKSQAHPSNGVFLYRIAWQGKSIVVASDIEGYRGVDRHLIEFAHGADILIHDAQYSEPDYLNKQGWGHSTPRMACEVAQLANVKQLILTHHDPTYDDAMVAQLEREAQSYFPKTIAAYEGLEIEL